AEARNALRKIARPDANVVLQMGLLSLQERQFAQAEEEFARSFQMDDASYAAGHNLLMTRLALGSIEECINLIPLLLPLIPSPEERRFLVMLRALLQSVQQSGRQGEADLAPLERASEIVNLSPADEQRLLELVRSLGELETAYSLLRAVAGAHPHNPALQEA